MYQIPIDKPLTKHLRVITLVLLGAILTACGSSSTPTADVDATPVNAGSDLPGNDEPAADDPVDNPVEDPVDEPLEPLVVTTGNDRNSISSPLLSLNPGGPGGSPNQSLRAGDVIEGDERNELLIGGLGVDVLIGADGNDVLIGGTEEFVFFFKSVIINIL